MMAKTTSSEEPKYTVKEVADKLGLSTYTVRYYDNAGLVPGVERTDGNIRMFSEQNISWLKLIHCLRTTGLPIDKVRHYVQMCLQGESTIPERAELIFQQERNLREQLKTLNRQMEILKYKKQHYQQLLANPQTGVDCCNPHTRQEKSEPNILPKK